MEVQKVKRGKLNPNFQKTVITTSQHCCQRYKTRIYFFEKELILLLRKQYTSSKKKKKKVSCSSLSWLPFVEHDFWCFYIHCNYQVQMLASLYKSKNKEVNQVFSLSSKPSGGQYDQSVPGSGHKKCTDSRQFGTIIELTRSETAPSTQNDVTEKYHSPLGLTTPAAPSFLSKPLFLSINKHQKLVMFSP